MTTQLDALLSRFGAMAGGWTPETPLDAMRRGLDDIFTDYPLAEGTSIALAGGNVPGEWVVAKGAAPDKAMLLIHGGGFSMGSARAHRAYASHLSAACGVRVFAIDYRLAPEHLYPAAHDDCQAGWDCILKSGVSPENIVVCGDSAGGGMALSLAVRLRDACMPTPACIVLVSPWADMAARGDSYDDPAVADPISSREIALDMARGYLGNADPNDPHVSPVNADLANLPPVLIEVGEREVFLDDARTIARRIRDVGGEVHLDIWPGMIHQFPLHVGALDEASAAIGKIGVFVRGRLR